jgi:hypothetical protein
LLSRQVPNGEMVLVFKRALQLAKAELMKRKYAVTDRPGRSRGSKSARHISAETRRQVHEREEGRCAFVSEAGKRCESRHMLEFDHDAPRACGGESTPGNFRQDPRDATGGDVLTVARAVRARRSEDFVQRTMRRDCWPPGYSRRTT